MPADDELEKWQQQWRAQPAVPVDLRRLVERDIRSRRVSTMLSIAVTVMMGGGTTVWAARSGERDLFILTFTVWVFIAVAWALALQLERQRGPRPLSETTRAFLDYAIRSRRARLQGITASAVLYVVLFTFVLVWRYGAGDAPPPDPWAYATSTRVLILLGISSALAVIAALQHHRLARELHNLETMHEALERTETAEARP